LVASFFILLLPSLHLLKGWTDVSRDPSLH
jgi:hypothetical protein